LLVIPADAVERNLTYRTLIEALREAFAEGVSAPTRHHHTMERPDGAAGTLLIMPAWSDAEKRGTASGGFLGVKIVTVNPDNNRRGRPAVMGTYYLADGETGEPLALMDGQALTVWRTACASALAASYLARADAEHLVMIGAGKLAPHLVRAHASVRRLARVTLWNRTREKAEALAAELAGEDFAVSVTDDREQAIRQADIVSSATISAVPLIEGRWLKEGAHVDLVGAFTPKLRESDDEAVRRATLFVDTYDGALTEGGDLVQPLQAGVIARSDVKADLAMLSRGEHAGRQSAEEITLFKSTGAAIEDFAAGCLVYRNEKAGRGL